MGCARGSKVASPRAPTNGALLAVLLAANVSYGRWIRFAVPGALLVSIVGGAGIALAR